MSLPLPFVFEAERTERGGLGKGTATAWASSETVAAVVEFCLAEAATDCRRQVDALIGRLAPLEEALRACAVELASLRTQDVSGAVSPDREASARWRSNGATKQSTAVGTHPPPRGAARGAARGQRGGPRSGCGGSGGSLQRGPRRVTIPRNSDCSSGITCVIGGVGAQA